jgi:hypothetical protein
LRKRFYLGCALLHLFLLATVSSHDTLSVLAQGHTLFPDAFESYWQKAKWLAALTLGQTLTSSNPLRQGLTAYIHCAGIEGGYGFFAPGVPNSYKLVFELHYNDGRVEYELPHISDPAMDVRFSSLLDYIGRTEYDPLRELMLKVLTYSAWQEHSDAATIRTVFGIIEEPSAAEASQGKKESYKFLYAYDFSFPSPQTPSKSP